jgi:hypothetical protein
MSVVAPSSIGTVTALAASVHRVCIREFGTHYMVERRGVLSAPHKTAGLEDSVGST